MALTKVSYSMITGSPANILDFGAMGDGSTDDSAAFTAALATNPSQLIIPKGTGDYIINTPQVIGSAIQIIGTGNPTIKSTVAGTRLFAASSLDGVEFRGITFKGSSSSTVPTSAYSAVAAANCGLITLYQCRNVNVNNCTFSTFYNGAVFIQCTDVWFNENLVTHWYVYGVLGSLSSRIWVDYNDIITCDFAGAGNAYGVMITGDQAGGKTSITCSVSNNYIKTIPSWDGIMTHDITNLRIANNIIENVRIGIDVGHATGGSTNVIKSVLVEGNMISLTSTDTWAGAGAAHNGVAVIGYSSTVQCERVSVIGNLVDNFGNITGATLSGTPAPYGFQNVRNLNATGNQITNAGSVNTIPGIYLVGTLNCVAITGNVLNGTFGSGAIRTASATIDYISVTGNTTTDGNTANVNEYYAAGTITQLSSQSNVSNSVPYALSATITNSNVTLYSAVTAWNPGVIASGASASTSITVTGAALGDVAFASYSLTLSGLGITAYVSSANTVTIVLNNNTGGSVTITGGNVYCGSTKRFR